ncbi:MAG: YbaB/EbfC family nucleoid-associated protein [Hydrogenobacter sp.]|uniref:YbaB/EbfC family nucleoid-associated protein n=1 Tax=Hydrogenobacter thermophilus TaxID=940 RepID=UPI0030FA5E79
MNLTEFIKNLKGFEGLVNSLKDELRQKREIIEKDKITIVFNGLGEVIDIRCGEGAKFDEVKDTLMELINQAQDISRDMMMEALKKRFGGILGF